MDTQDGAASAAAGPFAAWRLTGLGLVRIAFGVVWAVDAWFKWQPDFLDNFTSYLTTTQQADGQPGWVRGWIGFWINTVNVEPHHFAVFVAVVETLLAIALIAGAMTNVAYLAGMLMSLVIWTTAESFGGPYSAGSTDVGAAIMYAIIFVALFLTSAGRYLGVDSRITPRLGRFGWLAAGSFPPDPSRHRPATERARTAGPPDS